MQYRITVRRFNKSEGVAIVCKEVHHLTILLHRARIAGRGRVGATTARGLVRLTLQSVQTADDGVKKYHRKSKHNCGNDFIRCKPHEHSVKCRINYPMVFFTFSATLFTSV